MDFKLFSFLFAITVFPLFLVFQFFPWEVPQIQFFFLGLLFVTRIIFFREEEYKKNIKSTARVELQKKIKRVPSDSEIIDYIDKKISSRNLSFIVTGVLIFILPVMYGKIG